MEELNNRAVAGVIEQYHRHTIRGNVPRKVRVQKSARVRVWVENDNRQFRCVDWRCRSTADGVADVFEHGPRGGVEKELLVTNSRCGKRHVAVPTHICAERAVDGEEYAGHYTAVLTSVVGIFPRGIRERDVCDGDAVGVRCGIRVWEQDCWGTLAEDGEEDDEEKGDG